jgi:hypothetical protein
MYNWKDDGTKILGYLIAINSALAAGSVTLPAPLSAHAAAITQWAAFINTILGIVVVGRGHANSAAAGNVAAGNVSTPKSYLLWLVAPLAVLLLSSCTSLGLAAPKTFNEKLAVGYGTATAVLTTTDTLLTAGKIDAKTAKNIEAQEVNLKEPLDLAAQANVANQADGGNKLQTALTALNALSTYLATLK